ncbi:MAG: hypothetical protein ACLFUS_10000 [Candidatus Sumerlaeia bacterium]
MTPTKLSKKKLEELDRKIDVCKDYANEWSKFFNFFADGFQNRKITGESEGQFFRTMTDLARKQYRLRFFLGNNCPADDRMLQILSDAVSLTNIAEMSEAQFNKMQHSWHVIFIALNKALGRLIQAREAGSPKGEQSNRMPEVVSDIAETQAHQEAPK